MIKYALRCEDEHEFEGWFSGSADYEHQSAEGLLSCPVCGSAEVRKALMAPYVAKSGRGSSEAEQKLAVLRAQMNEAARKVRDHVEKTFEGVGDRFAEEARKIHYGEAEDRPIYGVASAAEAKALNEEGVGIARIPEPEPAPDEVKKKMN